MHSADLTADSTRVLRSVSVCVCVYVKGRKRDTGWCHLDRATAVFKGPSGCNPTPILYPNTPPSPKYEVLAQDLAWLHGEV